MFRPTSSLQRRDNIEYIDRHSGPKVAFYGTRFRELTLPVGSRVIYPNAPMTPLRDVKAAIRHALNYPHEMEPLFALLKPGMKLTIAIDDISLPLPGMVKPDIRELILTEILKLCAQYGVEDIHMIIAICLHRRMTGPEIKEIVGDKIYQEYYPDRLYNHDAEDPDGIVELGEAEGGHVVRLNRRAVESDLLIYVNVNFVPMDGGHKSVTVGLCDYKSVSEHHNTKTMHKCHSYMDPRHDKSQLAKRVDLMGQLVDKKLKVFHIETAINNKMFGGPLSFLNKPERTWSTFDWAKLRASNATLERMPESARRKIFEQVKAPYGVVAVHAGKTEPTHKQILEANFRQYSVPVKGQAEVLISGIPFISPYNVNSILNPILIQVMALGYLFNFYRNMPLIKKGGVLIITHPCHEEFNREHHPSYVEFYHRILNISKYSPDISHLEHELVNNPDYIQMYRKGHAYHPVHPFYMWYWGDAGRAHVGEVIVVGAEHPRVPTQLGWKNAKSLDEALEMAQGFLNKSCPNITMTSAPPIFIADMEE